MKTLKDLGKKHYEKIHYSFDIHYYPNHDEDMYVGILKNIMKIRGYEIRLKDLTIEGLVKKADNFLTMCKSIRVNREGMKWQVFQWNIDNPEDMKLSLETYNDLKTKKEVKQ
tara:strand:+ start:6120 stop:6455 length:336 start_codon:yes stop_codon:yes gene_type:complete